MPEIQMKILIVDDEPLNIDVLHNLLKEDYKIMAAINGKQALKVALSDSPPDLILLDIMMPEMDGYEVCSLLKSEEKTKNIPVIFVTAMGQITDETKGLEVGAIDYLTKPISPPIVQARIKTHLELKKRRDELQKAYNVIESQKKRMQDELDFGRDIQMSMVPQEFPAFPDRNELSIHAILHPAKEVGGDFYDYFFIDENRICICVGDVSGKGVPAALFMAVTRTLVRARASDEFSTASIITRVNDELSQDNKQCMFVTVFLAILDVVSGVLTYTNGGHNPPIIRSAQNETFLLDNRHGPVLGAVSGLTYKEDFYQLQKDDLLFLFTDGITEAMNPENSFFGDNHLLELISKSKIEDPEEVVTFIYNQIKLFEDGADQFDDITALAMRYDVVPDLDELFKVEIHIGNKLSEMDVVKLKFSDFAKENAIPQSLRRQLILVLDELLNNVISNAYIDDEKHEISISFELTSNRLCIIITDDGIPFNPFERAGLDITSGVEDRESGGLGIDLVKNLMDKTTYQRRVDQNIVTLVKRIDRSQIE